VLGGQQPQRRSNRAIATNGNGLASTNGAAAAAKHQLINNGAKNNNGAAVNGNRLLEQQRQSMANNSRKYMNGTASLTNGYLNGLSNNKVNGHATETSSSSNQQQQTQDKSTSNGSSNSYSSDLIVVLDMDECLIHSQFLSDQMVDKYRQYEERPDTTPTSPFGNNEEAIMWQTCDSFRINLPDGDLVNVNKRPNLDLFLREITGKFETYIFTAAMEVYAAPVLNKLDPTGEMFRGRFYREHCVYDPDLGVYAKDLCEVLRQRKMMINEGTTAEDDHEECGSCDERRVVLVDNNPLSFIPNPSNGILVSSFYDDPKDDTLEAVMELLHELDESEDVRPVLEDKFGLKDALDDVVKGAPVGW
jgi:CTD small phosphatase-like protein 2